MFLDPRKSLCLVIAFLLCIATSPIQQGNRANAKAIPVIAQSAVTMHPLQPLITAFYATKAAVTGYEVHTFREENNTWQKVPILQHAIRHRFIALHAILQTLTTKASSKRQDVLGTGYREEQVGKERVRETVTVQIASFWQGKQAMTLQVERIVAKRNDLAGFRTAYTALAQSARSKGIETALIEGMLPTSMPKVKQQALIVRALHAVHAVPGKMISDAYTSSALGTFGMTTATLQIATHRDTRQDRTKVLVGCPLITVEY